MRRAHPVLLRAVRSLDEVGLVKEATAKLVTLHEGCLRVLGPDHLDTFAARGMLAYLWGKAGDHRGAAEGFERLLADQLRVLGPHHPIPCPPGRVLPTGASGWVT